MIIDLSLVKIVMVLIGITGIIYALFKLWHGMGLGALSIFKWFLYGLGTLVVIWGLYNYIGSQFRLWEPLTLDIWIDQALEKLGIKDFIDFLNKWLEGISA